MPQKKKLSRPHPLPRPHLPQAHGPLLTRAPARRRDGGRRATSPRAAPRPPRVLRVGADASLASAGAAAPRLCPPSRDLVPVRGAWLVSVLTFARLSRPPPSLSGVAGECPKGGHAAAAGADRASYTARGVGPDAAPRRGPPPAAESGRPAAIADDVLQAGPPRPGASI